MTSTGHRNYSIPLHISHLPFLIICTHFIFAHHLVIYPLIYLAPTFCFHFSLILFWCPHWILSIGSLLLKNIYTSSMMCFHLLYLYSLCCDKIELYIRFIKAVSFSGALISIMCFLHTSTHHNRFMGISLWMGCDALKCLNVLIINSVLWLLFIVTLLMVGVFMHSTVNKV